MKRFLFLIGIVGFFASCGKSTKYDQENEPDSLLNVRAAVVSQRLPHEEGSLTMVKCEYDGKTVKISIRNVRIPVAIPAPVFPKRWMARDVEMEIRC